MENTKYIKLEIKAEDYPYIAEAFAYAFFLTIKLNTKKKTKNKKFSRSCRESKWAKIEILWK